MADVPGLGFGYAWLDRSVYVIGIAGGGWKEAVPGTSCLELLHVQHWNKRFTQLMSYTRCLKAKDPFTCLWIEADKSHH
jgi:hypothetical protein